MNIMKFFQSLTKKDKNKFVNNVYNILMEYGASENMKDAFINYILDKSEKNNIGNSKEWRFQGKFGFGGKYYFPENEITCYSEDYNLCKSLLEEANKKLHLLIM